MLFVDKNNINDYRNQMNDAYRLRHQVFVEEKGWNALHKPDGREIDQFDDERALHMLHYEGSDLVGYQRMLPTTKPNLLSDVYPFLCEEALPNDTQVWEWTRFAVAKEHRKAGRKLSPVASLLLLNIVEWGLENSVNSIVIEMNPLWLLRLVQLHFRVRPLGFPYSIEGEDTLAVIARFDDRTRDRLIETRTSISPLNKMGLSAKT